MALDQTPYIDPRTEADERSPVPAPRRKGSKDARKQDRPAADPQPVEGLDPQGHDGDDDHRTPLPPHFV